MKYDLEEILKTDKRKLDTLIPKLAKDKNYLSQANNYIASLETAHQIIIGDARKMKDIPDKSVHLIVTSPPYWTLKKYPEKKGQLGLIDSYNTFNNELKKVWKECYRVLVPGGRLIVVVGDVCLSRRRNKRHQVIPLHADIQINCRKIGFDNLAPIYWYKIANATYESGGNVGSFLGKPYEPNAIVKNDVEYILMERKPGGYRKPTAEKRLLSIIPFAEQKQLFNQIWRGITGESTRNHPAPYPQKLVSRLIRMYSFVGDIVLDPFMGSGTTIVTAMQLGRNSIGIEIEEKFAEDAYNRIKKHSTSVYGERKVIFKR